MRLKNPSLFIFTIAVLTTTSCKKNDVVTDLNPSPTVNAADALKDSAFSYTKDIYLWYNQLPASFKPGSYSGLNEMMTAIRQYSVEPGLTSPADRWSFAIKQSEWDDLSAGISGDFGISVFFRTEGDLRIKSVEKNSPAGLAGIRRGWQITAINGNNNISTSNAAYIQQAVWNSNSTRFSFLKPDGTSQDMILSAAAYQEHPVLLDTVFNLPGKHVGYFSFQSFLGDTLEIYNEFNRIFNHFAGTGVSDLIVDLRYNGGGYVSVQQKLANWLAPVSANGQLMMKQQFNDKYTAYNEDEYISKLGSLNLTRIFFIVSGSTASASELLINNLKPFMDVKLIGPSRTYGKPVGYFPIEVGDSYIFPVSFRSTNKNGIGNYFDGLALDQQIADGLDKDWGDMNEACLRQALQYIATGTFRLAGAVISAQHEVSTGNGILDRNSFKGMVDTR